VPLRKSLLVRLLATSLLVAFCAIVATAWLTVRTTTTAIRQEQGQVLADDAKVYDTLVGYAAVHPDWGGVGRTVRHLAEKTDRRITLTTQDLHRRPLADSAPSTSPLPAKASAVIDPLRMTGPALSPDSGAEQIDPRAVGPFRLTPAESAQVQHWTDSASRCLDARGIETTVTRTPGGRPRLDVKGRQIPRGKLHASCKVGSLYDDPTPTERSALAQLNDLIANCLKDHGLSPKEVVLDFSPDGPLTSLPPDVAPALQTCVDTSRREQLAPYTAPAALLFVSSPAGSPVFGFDLSRHNRARIVGVTAIVLALTVTATVVVSTRLTGPLRALTEAARDHRDRRPPVPVTGKDEIGRLATAFNDLTEHRERTEEQRKGMVSDIAHELRTPLSTIRSWLEAAQDGILVPDHDFTSALLEEALLLQHIVEDLQDLAAADSGTLRLHPEPLYVADLLSQVSTAHRGRATTAGVELSTYSEGDPLVTADAIRLRQVISNLVSNAVRHTPPGGTVTLRSCQEGNQVVIEVADTGTGIGPAELPLVFDRFWRAEKSRSRATGGSGLGLAIVRQLTEAHGGTVTATSVPGTETVFTVRLPA
jgi:two-component system sensor histidine kinase BaeS